MMIKQQILDFLKEDHERLEFVVESLHKEEMLKFIFQGNWNGKDILAHVTSWNKELAKSCDLLLKNEKPWFVEERYKTKKLETEFNILQVTIRKSLSLEEVKNEWQKSFKNLINKIESLTEEQLNFATKYNWPGGYPATVKSLFEYRYKGEELGHEGGHAKVIDEYFNEDRCGCREY